MASATGQAQKKQPVSRLVNFNRGSPVSSGQKAFSENAGVQDALARLTAMMPAGMATGVGKAKKNTSGVPLNTAALQRPVEMRTITAQNVRSAEARREEMLKLEALAKEGFEKTARTLAKSIQESQEQIGKQLNDRFAALKSTMDTLNANIVSANEKGKEQFKQLQHKILQTENQINALRDKIRDTLKDLNTKDEARFKEAKSKLEEYNALINQLTAGLTKEIKDMDMNLNGKLRELADKLHDIDLAMNAGFEASKREIELEKLKLKDLIARAFDPAKLRELNNQLRDLEEDNQDVEIYVCLFCGSTLHGARCVSYDNKNTRKRYKITRRQMKKLQTLTTVGINNAFGEEAYYVQVGKGSQEQIIRNFENLIRRAGIAV